MPEILPENELAIEIYQRVANQHIMSGMGGAVDLNHVSLFYWLDVYELNNVQKKYIAGKVIMAYHHILGINNEKHKAERSIK